MADEVIRRQIRVQKRVDDRIAAWAESHGIAISTAYVFLATTQLDIVSRNTREIPIITDLDARN